MSIPGLCLICLHPGSFEHKLVDSILPPIDATSSNVDDLWLVLRKILRIDDDEQRLLAAVCHTCEKNESILYQIKDTQMLKDSAEVDRLMIENNIECIKTEETNCILIDHEMGIKNEPLSPGNVDERLQELPGKELTVDRESIIESSQMQTPNDFHIRANNTLRSENGRDIIKQQLNGYSNDFKNDLSSRPDCPSDAELETIVDKVQQPRQGFIRTYIEDDTKTIFRKVPRFRIFKCDLCSEKFVTTNSLTRHKKITHGQIILTYKCDQCLMIFTRSENLRKHKRICHNDV